MKEKYIKILIPIVANITIFSLIYIYFQRSGIDFEKTKFGWLFLAFLVYMIYEGYFTSDNK